MWHHHVLQKKVCENPTTLTPTTASPLSPVIRDFQDPSSNFFFFLVTSRKVSKLSQHWWQLTLTWALFPDTGGKTKQIKTKPILRSTDMKSVRVRVSSPSCKTDLAYRWALAMLMTRWSVQFLAQALQRNIHLQ